MGSQSFTKNYWPLPGMNPPVSCSVRVVCPETICIEITETDSVGCMYVCVHIHRHTYVCICNNNKEKWPSTLERGAMGAA